MVTVNGKQCRMEGKTVSELLQELEFNPAQIVVEINEAILGKDQYETVRLADGDVVEVVSFMGGG